MSDETLTTAKTAPDETSGCPWRLGKKYDLRPVWALHEELQDFFEYIKPTTVEYNMRLAVVDRVTKAIASEWPGAEVKVFGSFPNNLILPDSEMSIVVFGEWNPVPLQKVAKLLLDKGVCCEDFKILDKTKVPVVKITDKMSGVRADICFNVQNGVKATMMFQKFIDVYPMVPKLVLVIKQLLNQMQIYQTHTGGLTSYSLMLMVISFLQLYRNKKVFDDVPVNLGTLLMDFLELYGIKFDYSQAIRVTNGGSYVTKDEVHKHMIGGQKPGILCIEDPLTLGYDVSSGSYSVLKVKHTFARAFYVVKAAVEQHNFSPDESILGRLIRIDEGVKLRRQWVKDNANALQTVLGSGAIENDWTTVKVSENNTVAHNFCAVKTKPPSVTVPLSTNRYCNNNNSRTSGNGGKRPRETYHPLSSKRNLENDQEPDFLTAKRVKKSYMPYWRPIGVINETSSSNALPARSVTENVTVPENHHVNDENGGHHDGYSIGDFGNNYRNGNHRNTDQMS